MRVALLQRQRRAARRFFVEMKTAHHPLLAASSPPMNTLPPAHGGRGAREGPVIRAVHRATFMVVASENPFPLRSLFAGG